MSKMKIVTLLGVCASLFSAQFANAGDCLIQTTLKNGYKIAPWSEAQDFSDSTGCYGYGTSRLVDFQRFNEAVLSYLVTFNGQTVLQWGNGPTYPNYPTPPCPPTPDPTRPQHSTVTIPWPMVPNTNRYLDNGSSGRAACLELGFIGYIDGSMVTGPAAYLLPSYRLDADGSRYPTKSYGTSSITCYN